MKQKETSLATEETARIELILTRDLRGTAAPDAYPSNWSLGKARFAGLARLELRVACVAPRLPHGAVHRETLRLSAGDPGAFHAERPGFGVDGGARGPRSPFPRGVEHVFGDG